MLLNNQEVTEETKNKIKTYLEPNDDENTITQNLWDRAKEVLRRKIIAIQAYLKKQEKHQINNLTLHMKQLGKEEIAPERLLGYMTAPWCNPRANNQSVSPLPYRETYGFLLHLPVRIFHCLYQ